MAASLSASDDMEAGRAELCRGAWQRARDNFEQAIGREATPEAFEGLSWATWWLEDVPACLDAREQAYGRYRDRHDDRGAARMALWLGDDHLEFHGAEAVADGWFQRAGRILADLAPGPEHGWLAVFDAHAALGRHDPDAAIDAARRARELGRAAGLVDLEMFALATEGQAQVTAGRVAEGMRQLDEATVAALAGDYENLAPAAWTCCRLMSACEQVRDYERGAQWCREIERFSRRMDTRFVTGVCQAHHAAVLVWEGRFGQAEEVLAGALEHLSASRPHWRAEALVRLGELRRRQGRLAEAEDLFDRCGAHLMAARGMAEICLDREDPGGARDLLERLVRRIAEGDHLSRADVVEVLVRATAALGDSAATGTLLEELVTLASPLATAPWGAAVRHAEGLVAELTGDHALAARCFEDAVDLLSGGPAPLEVGRARGALSRNLMALGRTDRAWREARARLEALEALGAPVEAARARARLAHLGATSAAQATPGDAPLTARQREVLRLVAEGLGDREIAARLVLSEHTVHRHVANIYVRLECSSRAAAVAEASRLGLL